MCSSYLRTYVPISSTFWWWDNTRGQPAYPKCNPLPPPKKNKDKKIRPSKKNPLHTNQHANLKFISKLFIWSQEGSSRPKNVEKKPWLFCRCTTSGPVYRFKLLNNEQLSATEKKKKRHPPKNLTNRWTSVQPGQCWFSYLRFFLFEIGVSKVENLQSWASHHTNLEQVIHNFEPSTRKKIAEEKRNRDIHYTPIITWWHNFQSTSFFSKRL